MKKATLLILILIGAISIHAQNEEAKERANELNALYKNHCINLEDSISIYYENVIKTTKSKEVVFIANLLEHLRQNEWALNHQTFIKSQKIGSGFDWELTVNTLYMLAQRFVHKPSCFYSTMRAGEILSRENKVMLSWHLFQSSQAVMAALSRDIDTLKRVIDRMAIYPYANDSMKYTIFMRQKALLNEITLGDSIDFYYNKTIKLAKRHFKTQADSSMLAGTLSSYGNMLIRRGEINEAAMYFLDAKKVLPSSDRFALNRTELDIYLAKVYLDLSNTIKAKEYANKALALCDQYNFIKMKKGKVANLMGDIYSEAGEKESAIEQYSNSYELYSTKWISSFQPKLLANKLSKINASLGNLEEFEFWKREATKYKKSNDEIQILEYLGPAYAFFTQKKFNKALEQVNLAYRKALDIQAVRYESECLELLYKIHKAKGNAIKAIENLEGFIYLEDSLYKSGQELAVTELQNSYELNLKEEQINTLNAQNEVTQTKLEAQKILTTMTTLGLILLAGLLLSQFLLYKKLKVKNSLISKANEEKNILLKEIHHRVKNNLQVISSLLKLQSRYIKDDSAVKAIAEGRTRVQSMALLHQNLYQDDNLKGVNMKVYFDNLIQGLFDAYNIEDERVKLVTNIQPLILDVDTVIPLGLITNELISNALKHAFGKDETGTINVELKEEESGLILIVKDDGVGKDAKIVSEGQHKSFGQMLVQSLSTKLEAIIEENYQNGTEIKVQIKDYKIAA